MLFESINYGSSGSLLEGYSNNPDDLELMISCETMKMNEYLHNVSVAYMKAEFNEYARNGHISESSVKMLTEGLGDYLRRFWEWLKKLWNTIWSKLKEWWNKLFGSSSSNAKGDSDPSFSKLYDKMKELDAQRITKTKSANKHGEILCSKEKLSLYFDKLTNDVTKLATKAGDTYITGITDEIKKSASAASGGTTAVDKVMADFIAKYTADEKATLLKKFQIEINNAMGSPRDDFKREDVTVAKAQTATAGSALAGLTPATGFEVTEVTAALAVAVHSTSQNIDAAIKNMTGVIQEVERKQLSDVKHDAALSAHLTKYTSAVNIASSIAISLLSNIKTGINNYHSDMSAIVNNFHIKMES